MIRTIVICDTAYNFGNCAITCSEKNADAIKSLLPEKYHQWAKEAKENKGCNPLNDLLSWIRELRVLLKDEINLISLIDICEIKKTDQKSR